MRFSERMGAKKPRSEPQVASIDKNLRTALWNTAYQAMERVLGHGYGIDSRWEPFARIVWQNLLKQPIDEMPEIAGEAIEEIKDWFFNTQWYEVYDFLEVLAQALVGALNRQESEAFKDACNIMLEREYSGYRFVGKEISRITDQLEVTAIEKALDGTEQHGLSGAREHLRSALEKFSDRRNPDYRNSIKESVSAVESICKLLSGRLHATLPDAIKALKDEGIAIHPALEQGIGKIYAYTSDADGIRHAMTDQSTCDFDDAKYMLVSSSAFVNYLIGKASRAGLLK